MENQKTKKQTVHLSAENHQKFQEILEFLRKDSLSRLTESRAIQVLIEIVYDLFIENNTAPFSERLLQLKNTKSKNTELILSQLAIQKQLLNQLIYLSLATYHVADDGPAWAIEDLESIEQSGQDSSQKILLAKIQDLIQRDKEIAQVKKHSH